MHLFVCVHLSSASMCNCACMCAPVCPQVFMHACMCPHMELCMLVYQCLHVLACVCVCFTTLGLSLPPQEAHPARSRPGFRTVGESCCTAGGWQRATGRGPGSPLGETGVWYFHGEAGCLGQRNGHGWDPGSDLPGAGANSDRSHKRAARLVEPTQGRSHVVHPPCLSAPHPRTLGLGGLAACLCPWGHADSRITGDRGPQQGCKGQGGGWKGWC